MYFGDELDHWKIHRSELEREAQEARLARLLRRARRGGARAHPEPAGHPAAPGWSLQIGRRKAA